MTKAKLIARQIPLLILCLMFSVLVWSFVFNLIRDTDAAHKLVVYVHADVPDSRGFSVRLEEGRGEGIRMVCVHPFEYALMDSSELVRSDLFVLPESDLEAYFDWLAPVPEPLRGAGELWTSEDGEPYAVRLPEEAGDGRWIRYEGAETLWLAFGAQSAHLPGNAEAADAEAVALAEELLMLLDAGTETE